MIHSILVFNSKADVLIRKDYKTGIKKQDVAFCATKIVQADLSPVMAIPKFSNSTNQLYFVAVPKSEIIMGAIVSYNLNIALLLEMLVRTASLIEAFAGDLSETSISRNVPTVSGLLDECIDNGVPQILEKQALKHLIVPPTEAMTTNQLIGITAQATGSCSWRSPGIHYRRNEVFIDVMESINAVIAHSGQVLRSDVVGQVIVKSMLSGIPECKFGVSGKLIDDIENSSPTKHQDITLLDDIRFHHCVKPNNDKSMSITFIPPDGQFQLMSYRVSRSVGLPFRLSPTVEQHGSRVAVSLKVTTHFPKSMYASNVVVMIPCPHNTARVIISSCISSYPKKDMLTAFGKAKYEPGKGGVSWQMRRVSGDTELRMSFDVDIVTGVGHAIVSSSLEKALSADWRVKPPITLEFELPMHAASGLTVRFLKISEKSGYKAVKWIRYMTKAGLYQQRI